MRHYCIWNSNKWFIEMWNQKTYWLVMRILNYVTLDGLFMMTISRQEWLSVALLIMSHLKWSTMRSMIVEWILGVLVFSLMNCWLVNHHSVLIYVVSTMIIRWVIKWYSEISLNIKKNKFSFQIMLVIMHVSLLEVFWKRIKNKGHNWSIWKEINGF